MQYILVVEDDFDLNQAICYSLKKSGYGVYGVTFMEKGKQIFFENQIDMVLLDVNLPDGEGFSFCQWVKKQREVPVIYLTARDMEEDALAGYESGAEDYVTKPFSMKILLRIDDCQTWRYAHMLLYELTFPTILLGITILFALPNKSKTVMIWSILLYIGTPSILSYFYCRKRH